jgi:integrase
VTTVTEPARRLRLHDVRHTYSTLSLDTGIEPKILSDLVGHSNPAVTFQIYAHRSRRARTAPRRSSSAD